MGINFHETVMGRRFFEGQLPKLIKAIEDNTAEMKRANNLKEIEVKLLKMGVIQIEDGEPEPVQDARDSLHDSRD